MTLENELTLALKNDLDLASETISIISSIDGWFDDDQMYPFDEDFFRTYFSDNPMEVCRATLFGDVNWLDEYIGFDGNGNLYTLTKWEYAEVLSGLADDMADHMIDIYDKYGDNFPDEIIEIFESYKSANRKPKVAKKPTTKRKPTVKPKAVKKKPTVKKPTRRK